MTAPGHPRGRRRLGGIGLLLVVVALLLLLTVVVSALVVIDEARDELTKQVQAAETLAATERATELGVRFDEAIDRLSTLARLPAVAEAIGAGRADDLEAQIDTLVTDAITGIAIVSRDGAPLVAAGDDVVLPPGDEPAFSTSDDRTSATVTIRAPIGDVAWAVESLDVGALSPQLEQPFAEFEGRTGLVRRDGMIVMASAPAPTPFANSPEILDLVAGGRPGVAVYDSVTLHARRIAAVAPVPGSDLMVVVGADASVAHQPATALARRLGVVLLVSAAIAAALVATAVVALRRSRRELEAHRRTANELAHTDPLTGLANRRALDRASTELIGPVGVVAVDLDRLKHINDTYGHAAGDLAIIATANVIAAAVRPGDLAARVGGDEFVVLLAGADHARASAIAERIHRAVATARGPAEQPIAVSTGFAAGDADDIDDLLQVADRRLYEAKGARTTAANAAVGDAGGPGRI